MSKIALVGDRSAQVRSHARIPVLLDALRADDRLDLDVYWVPSADAFDVKGFDGIWVVPGSPYASEEGALAAIRTAREQRIPLLGTCGGFQHAMLEYARNVCGLGQVAHAENHPDASDLLIQPLACSLFGHEAGVRVTPGSRAERILGAERTTERYHCSYGLNPGYLDTLRAHGLLFTGFDDEGDVRIAELPDDVHPFFFCAMFQPELADADVRPHPIVRAFAAATAA